MKVRVAENRTAIPSEEEWVRIVQTEIKKYRKIMRKQFVSENDISGWDLTEPLARRRAKAIVKAMPEIYRRYQIPENIRPALGESWMELNLPFITYSEMDSHAHLLYAASIWVLDQITRSEGWQELYRLLPTEESAIDELCLHTAWHCQYKEDLIYSVEYVLHHRNALEINGSDLPRTLTSEYLAKRGKNRGEPDQDRKNYEALIAMIPQEAIAAAVERFKTYFWQWVDRFFAGVAPFHQADSELLTRIREGQMRMNDMIDKLAALRKKVELLEKQKPFPPVKTVNPLLMKPQKDLGELFQPWRSDLLTGLHGMERSEKDRLKGEGRVLCQRIDALSTAVDKDMEKARELRGSLRKFEMRMARMGRITENDLEDFGEVPVSAMEPLRISDPYELCFALLYLIEADDDLPWLYGAGCGLMNEVIDTLPWGILEYEEEEEDEVQRGEEAQLPKSVSIPDWYHRAYRMRGQECDLPRNLAQILYETTGCVPPKDLCTYSARAKALGKYGIRGKDAASMLVLMSALGSARRAAEARNLDREMNLLLGKPAAGPQEKKGERTQGNTLEGLKRENEKLKAALHASDKENRETKKKLASLQAEARREHRELADLREYVFNTEEAQAQEEPEEINAAQWPYEVQKDTLIFGGHATWTKGIKGILKGNVRFIPKDFVFDTGIIKRADVLWIQPNALSHKMFYRIIDMARACGKPVRYFTFASWAKCAQQLAEGDEQ